MTRKHAPEEAIRVPIATGHLKGTLVVPRDARALVIFAHGSGSGRHSPRNRFVAEQLNGGGLGTLLVDLLTPEEERQDETTAEFRFDIELLGDRVVTVIDWMLERDGEGAHAIGLFGASTGAAAALVAAARRPGVVGALVSRGGRPDLAGGALGRCPAPTLLIAGGRDVPVLALNREALDRLACDAQLAVVPGATHLFEEPGGLEVVAELAREWFTRYLIPAHVHLPHGEPGIIS